MSETYYPAERTGKEFYDDEIDIIELLKVIWNRRLVIAFGVILFTVIGGTFSFFKDRVYRVETVISPGVADIKDDGSIVLLETPDNIKSLIDSGSFDTALLKVYKNDILQSSPDFNQDISLNVEILNKTNTLIVSTETSDTEAGEVLLAALNQELLNKYFRITDFYKKKSEAGIQAVKNEISDLENKILDVKNGIEVFQNSFVNELKDIDGRIKISKFNKKICELKKEGLREYIVAQKTEAEKIRKNTDKLILQRDKLIEDESVSTASLSLMIYLNVVQQNLALINSIGLSLRESYREFNDLDMEISVIQENIDNLSNSKVLKQENFKIELKTKKNLIYSLQDEIAAKQSIKDQYLAKKNIISNIQILQEPRSKKAPVAPNRKLIVILSFFTSFFVMVFGVLFYDYIKKNW